MSEADANASLPTATRLLLAIPLGISAVALAGALWFVFQDEGRIALGDRVTLHFQSACPEAAAVVQERADLIGLGQPALVAETGGFALTATLPGLPDDRTAIPALLAKPGRLTLQVGGREIADGTDISGASVALDAGGNPYARLDLNPLAATALREAIAAGGALDLRLDEAVLLHQDPAEAPAKDQMSIYPPDGEAQARMRAATDWTILLVSGALPCEVSAASVVQGQALR